MAMSKIIETRDQSVDYFVSKGFHAFKRDWVMGKTVGATAGEANHDKTGIILRQHLLYLHIHEDEWAISDLIYQVSTPIKCKTLENATFKAEEMLKEKIRNQNA